MTIWSWFFNDYGYPPGQPNSRDLNTRGWRHLLQQVTWDFPAISLFMEIAGDWLTSQFIVTWSLYLRAAQNGVISTFGLPKHKNKAYKQHRASIKRLHKFTAFPLLKSFHSPQSLESTDGKAYLAWQRSRIATEFVKRMDNNLRGWTMNWCGGRGQLAHFVGAVVFICCRTRLHLICIYLLIKLKA